MQSWVDGAPATVVGTDDRGLLYGDGLFETLAVVDGRCRWSERHLDRLYNDATRIGLEAGLPARGDLEAELARFMRACGAAPSVVRLTITRGGGGRGYAPPSDQRPRRIMSQHALPEPVGAEGASVRICETRWPDDPRLAGIKHLNRMHQVLARSEWDDPSIWEGLMLGPSGEIVSGTRSNLFLRDDKRVRTPVLDRYGVAGVMRSVLIGTLREDGITVDVGTVTPEELNAADEVFLCNAVHGVVPVSSIADFEFHLGDLSHRLRHALAPVS